MVGEFALLKVVAVSNFGAFLDWGLMKDLLVPFREQKEKMDDLSESVLNILKKNKGAMNVNDKSAPELIEDLFGMSKKNFKKAIGALYKKRIIELDDKGIRLLKDAD